MIDGNSIWMPLKGPVRDWPLALCHPKSIDRVKDIEPADLVYPRYNIEICQLYWSPNHKWCYLSDQQSYEALVFTQSESSPDSASGNSMCIPKPGNLCLLAVSCPTCIVSHARVRHRERASGKYRGQGYSLLCQPLNQFSLRRQSLENSHISLTRRHGP